MEMWNVGGESQPQLSGVEQGHVGIDETGILQRLDPARTRGGESPTSSASSRLLMRPFSCINSEYACLYDQVSAFSVPRCNY